MKMMCEYMWEDGIGESMFMIATFLLSIAQNHKISINVQSRTSSISILLLKYGDKY